MAELPPFPLGQIDNDEIALMHPDAWGGQTFGRGEITPLGAPVPFRARARAVQSIQNFEGTPDDFSLQTFANDTLFDPRAFPKGTIVSGERERVYTKGRFAPIDLGVFEGVTPFTGEPVIDSAQLLTSPVMAYVRERTVGATALSRFGRRGHLLHRVTYFADPPISILPPLPVPGIEAAHSPVKVGSVIHRVGAQTEQLSRIVEIRVLHRGPNGPRIFTLEWLGNLVPKPA